MLLTEENSKDSIRSLLRNAKEAKFAVAFWGDGALTLLDSFKGVAQVICNLSSGACNPNEVRKLIARFGRENVKNHPTLHAKVYWTPDGFVLGSSNASANGLGFEDQELRAWHEANLLIRDRVLISSVAVWVDKIFDNATKITGAELDRAEKTWRMRRNDRDRGYIAPRDSATLFAKAQNDPGFFKDKRIYITVADAQAEAHEKDALRHWQVQLMDKSLESYSGVWSVEPGDFVLDFWRTKRSVSFKGLYKIDEDQPRRRFRGTEIILTRKVSDFKGIGAPALRSPEAKQWGDWLASVFEISRAKNSIATKRLIDDLLHDKKKLALYDFIERAHELVFEN